MERNLHVVLPLCHQVMYKYVIAMPCIVNGSDILTFSYTTSYTCISPLFCLTYHVMVINNLKQEVWVSSYKLKDLSWPTFLKPFDWNKVTTDSYIQSIFLHNFSGNHGFA